MTHDRFAELDETPEQPWRPTSTAQRRQWALEQTRAAVEAAKERRKRKTGE